MQPLQHSSCNHPSQNNLEEKFERLVQIGKKIQEIDPKSDPFYANLSNEFNKISNLTLQEREDFSTKLAHVLAHQEKVLATALEKSTKLKRQSSLTHRRTRPLDGTY